MKAWLKQVARGRSSAQDLEGPEALQAAEALFDEATQNQAAAFLIALRMKSESPQELQALLGALRARTQRLPLPADLAARSIDWALSHEGRRSFCASLGAGLLCALAGLPLLLHESEPLPPLQALGVGQLLRSLGLAPAQAPQAVAADLARLGIAYADDEKLCPALARLRPVREDLGLRTVLHLIGRLGNPGGARQLLLGLPHPAAFARVRSLVPVAGYDRVVAVLGNDGSEELPTHKAAQVLMVEDGRARSLSLNAEELGLQTPAPRALGLREQGSQLSRLLSGEEHPDLEHERKRVLFNAACLLWLFGRALSLPEGLDQATELLRSGRGLTLLFKWAKTPPLGAKAMTPK